MKKSWFSVFKNDFNLNGTTEVYFWKSEWEKFDPHEYQASGRVSLFYFTYRLLYMAWFVGAYSENFVCNRNEDNNYYGLYLTNQTFTLQLVYSVFYFAYICWIFFTTPNRKKPGLNNNNDTEDFSASLSFHKDSYQLPIFCKILWILINILNVIPYVVTVIYWLFLYGGDEDKRTCEVLVNILVHGINSPLVLLDAFIMAVPIRRTHSIFPALFAVYYTVFSGLYEVFNGRYNDADDKEYIYPMLNWRNQPGFAVCTCVGSIIGAFLIHFVMSWGVYRLRIYLKYIRFSGHSVDEGNTY